MREVPGLTAPGAAKFTERQIERDADEELYTPVTGYRLKETAMIMRLVKAAALVWLAKKFKQKVVDEDASRPSRRTASTR